jgi:hypothetical protein
VHLKVLCTTKSFASDEEITTVAEGKKVGGSHVPRLPLGQAGVEKGGGSVVSLTVQEVPAGWVKVCS